MTNLDSMLKSRDITLPAKVCLVKAMVFPVVMYGCESWTIKKAERWRIDAFELWCWRRLLRVSWTARRSNQSILNDISPEYSLDAEAETPILATWWEELKSFLMKMKEESEKVGLRLNIHKNYIMASSPITSWQIDGETVETVSSSVQLISCV